jgi:hypothetical protein
MGCGWMVRGQVGLVGLRNGTVLILTKCVAFRLLFACFACVPMELSHLGHVTSSM